MPKVFLAFFSMIAIVTTFASEPVSAQVVTQICDPVVSAVQQVASPQQRLAAGNMAEPPLTDHANGFAWPDTPIGVLKNGDTYTFFGSDGGDHMIQLWNGSYYGNDKFGSADSVVGTLDNPLGSGPPANITISPNPDPNVNPNYSRYDYMGGGPVYRVPQGNVGAGNLLMVYHGEIPTITTQSFYSVLALAASSDEGAHWTDLGEIIEINQPYRIDLDGFDIGDQTLVPSLDGQYLQIYFRDWIKNGTTHWGNSLTNVSIARASIASVYGDAFGSEPHAASFNKYYLGTWLQPGINGLSSDLNPQSLWVGENQVLYDDYLQRYVMIVGEGVLMAYAESPDGMHWSLPLLIHDMRNQPDQPTGYVMPVGTGDDPHTLGQQFYVYYTRYPTTGGGWKAASLDRFTVTCN
jgi:hypothetical protein